MLERLQAEQLPDGLFPPPTGEGLPWSSKALATLTRELGPDGTWNGPHGEGSVQLGVVRIVDELASGAWREEEELYGLVWHADLLWTHQHRFARTARRDVLPAILDEIEARIQAPAPADLASPFYGSGPVALAATLGRRTRRPPLEHQALALLSGARVPNLGWTSRPRDGACVPATFHNSLGALAIMELRPPDLSLHLDDVLDLIRLDARDDPRLPRASPGSPTPVRWPAGSAFETLFHTCVALGSLLPARRPADESVCLRALDWLSHECHRQGEKMGAAGAVLVLDVMRHRQMPIGAVRSVLGKRLVAPRRSRAKRSGRLNSPRQMGIERLPAPGEDALEPWERVLLALCRATRGEDPTPTGARAGERAPLETTAKGLRREARYKSPSGIYGILESLQEAGYVSRTQERIPVRGEMKAQYAFFLTPKGEAHLRRVLPQLFQL